MSNISKKWKGKVVSEQENGGFTGMIADYEIDIDKKDLQIKWTGSPVPGRLIRKFVTWSREVLDEHGGECQGRLYYRETDDSWALAVKKQFISHGMESKEVGDDGDEEECRKQLPKKGSWVMNGTIHSHCTSSAFMSGTDEADEIKQNGIHITVGHINSKEYQIHYRVGFRGILYVFGTEADNVHVAEHCQSTKQLPKSCKTWGTMLVKIPLTNAITVIGGNNLRSYGAGVPRARNIDEFWGYMSQGYTVQQDAPFHIPHAEPIDDDHFDAIITLMTSIYVGSELEIAKMIYNKALEKENGTVEPEIMREHPDQTAFEFGQNIKDGDDGYSEGECAYCHEKGKLYHGVCEHCHLMFHKAGAVTSVCMTCGAKIEGSSDICPSCEADFQAYYDSRT